MAEIVNLKRAKKAKARRTAEETAAANRIVHGASKAVKTLVEAQRKKDASALDSHKLDEEN